MCLCVPWHGVYITGYTEVTRLWWYLGVPVRTVARCLHHWVYRGNTFMVVFGCACAYRGTVSTVSSHSVEESSAIIDD